MNLKKGIVILEGWYSMAFVILILMAFFCLIYLKQQVTKNSVNSGSRDPVIKKTLSYYRNLREHQSDIKTNAFAIGYAKKERKGNLEDNCDLMAVRILDDKGTRREGAEKLGMEVIQIKDRYFYQFTVELDSKMADAELSALLQRTKEKIEERYPDDFVGNAVGYITVVIDGKKVMEHLG